MNILYIYMFPICQQYSLGCVRVYFVKIQPKMKNSLLTRVTFFRLWSLKGDD